MGMGENMVEQQLDDFMTEEGYTKVPSNLPEFIFYYYTENNYVNVFHVIYCEKNLYITEEQYQHIKSKIKDFFKEKKMDDVHIMSLIVSREAEKGKRICKEDPFCWIIDPVNDRLVVYENQVGDFYGMRNKIECFLSQVSASGQETEDGEGDTDRAVKHDSRFRIPYVTTFLVAANILVFLICTFTGDLLYNEGAFNAGMFWEDREYYRILTSTFLHWDIDHLVSNMIVLYYLGEVVEKHFGGIKYSVIYLCAGILGNLLSAAYEVYKGIYISSAGASGAVFGVIGALFVLVCVHKGHLEQITMGRLLFMIGYSLYSGFAGSGINNAAHIGGFISGVVIAFVLWGLERKTGWE